jgi:hypothetical protein
VAKLDILLATAQMPVPVAAINVVEVMVVGTTAVMAADKANVARLVTLVVVMVTCHGTAPRARSVTTAAKV